MKQMYADMLNVLRDIDETNEDYGRAQWALEHDLSLFDFDDWLYCKGRMDELKISSIVAKQGGFRERKVLSEKHEMVRDETWNDDHKVVNVLSCVPEEDGYRSGFQVDLVTNSICG